MIRRSSFRVRCDPSEPGGDPHGSPASLAPRSGFISTRVTVTRCIRTERSRPVDAMDGRDGANRKFRREPPSGIGTPGTVSDHMDSNISHGAMPWLKALHERLQPYRSSRTGTSATGLPAQRVRPRAGAGSVLQRRYPQMRPRARPREAPAAGISSSAGALPAALQIIACFVSSSVGRILCPDGRPNSLLSVGEACRS